MFNEKEFLEKIKQKVLAHDAQASVILFGSRARGDHKPDSDWDLLVLTEQKAGYEFRDKLIGAIYEVELEYIQPISTVILETNQWEDVQLTSFYKNVMAQGKAV